MKQLSEIKRYAEGTKPAAAWNSHAQRPCGTGKQPPK